MNFSVGITVLKQYDMIKKCVAHVKASTIRPENIYVVDHGGELGRLDDCTVITPASHPGLAASWNFLLKIIHPDSAIILNDDCFVMPEAFSELMRPSGPALVRGHGHAVFRQDYGITEKVGLYDIHYYPAYYEDADYMRRMQLLNVPWIDLPRSVALSHGEYPKDHVYQNMNPEELKEMHECIEANKKRFVTKYGGLPSNFF